MPVGVALDISRSPIENKWGSLWCPGWLDRYAFEMLTLPNDGWKVINRWGWGVAGLMNWSPLLTLWVVLMTTCGATGGGGAVGLAMFCFQWWSYWICFSCMYILYQDAIKHLFILSLSLSNLCHSDYQLHCCRYYSCLPIFVVILLSHCEITWLRLMYDVITEALIQLRRLLILYENWTHFIH